ncbi:MAG: ATP-dependent metallopeptidase FtsH/Yme1/Tma family protein, partial [Deltaproteobacteria bacterium]|nr:ATP-dependent metallopeptidase FtsH/Yme1/Tma family protein [Deltaproteobacteria bacterium]
MSPFYKNLALWLVISLMMILLFNLFNNRQPTSNMVAYSELLTSIQSGEVSEVVIKGNEITGNRIDGRKFKSYTPNDPELIKLLREKNIKISAKPAAESPWYMSILISWFPMLLLIGVWIFFMRQMQGGGGKGPLSFGKSRAQLQTDQWNKVTFDDVAGIEEAKEELEEIIEFLRDPK